MTLTYAAQWKHTHTHARARTHTHTHTPTYTHKRTYTRARTHAHKHMRTLERRANTQNALQLSFVVAPTLPSALARLLSPSPHPALSRPVPFCDVTSIKDIRTSNISGLVVRVPSTLATELSIRNRILGMVIFSRIDSKRSESHDGYSSAIKRWL